MCISVRCIYDGIILSFICKCFLMLSYPITPVINTFRDISSISPHIFIQTGSLNKISCIFFRISPAHIHTPHLKPCGCGYKISFMRFYNRIIVLYQTNILVSHFIPQNRFRWNFSKRAAGKSTGKVVTGQINSNEHHRQEAIKVISTPKQLQSLQKSEINPSPKPVHQCTNQALIHPLIITHPEERIWAG